IVVWFVPHPMPTMHALQFLRLFVAGQRLWSAYLPIYGCPYDTAVFEHEATTSKISEDQLFYCNQRGIPTEEAVGLIVNGYAKDVLNKLPMEFAVEAQKLLSVSLEGTVG
ncbi:SUF system FeS cluster assembly, SufBD, partial [human gut metagenome]